LLSRALIHSSQLKPYFKLEFDYRSVIVLSAPPIAVFLIFLTRAIFASQFLEVIGLLFCFPLHRSFKRAYNFPRSKTAFTLIWLAMRHRQLTSVLVFSLVQETLRILLPRPGAS
jgi:hypothetical protein